MRGWLASCLVALAVVVPQPSAAAQPKSPAYDPPTAEERVKLRQMLDIVRQADRVVALPVVAAGTGLSMEWAVAETPVPLPLASGRSLGRRLARFDWERMSVKACGFQPGVAFRFYSGRRSAQVLVCFTCAEMALDGLGGALGNKKMLGDADLAAWRRAAQGAFPNKDFRTLP